VTGVRYAVSAGVATLTLDEADNKNSLSLTLVEGLGAALARAVADEDVRAVLLTNDGTTFCAGANLRGESASLASVGVVLAAIQDSPKPVIGAINGHCMGGGVGLAAACDISVVSREAKIGFTEVRLGVCPAVISVVVLPKLGRADAAELFLTGRRISADRAVEVGLVNYAVDAADLQAKADEVLAEVVQGGPLALAAAKALLTTVPQLSRDDAFAHTADLSQRMFASPEAQEGIAAFRERRAASWVPVRNA
jgi:methylglutaconyl-CoA hydratase